MSAAPSLDRFPTRLVIGGERVDAKSGESFEVVNPATEEVLTSVAEAGTDDVDAAVFQRRPQKSERFSSRHHPRAASSEGRCP